MSKRKSKPTLYKPHSFPREYAGMWDVPEQVTIDLDKFVINKRAPHILITLKYQGSVHQINLRRNT